MLDSERFLRQIVRACNLFIIIIIIRRRINNSNVDEVCQTLKHYTINCILATAVFCCEYVVVSVKGNYNFEKTVSNFDRASAMRLRLRMCKQKEDKTKKEKGGETFVFAVRTSISPLIDHSSNAFVIDAIGM